MKVQLKPKWGIRIVATWALVMAMVAFATLLLLTSTVELYSNAYGNQALVWIVFILNALFGMGFLASAYGLWKQQNWGRLAFLWTVGIWSLFNLFALFDPGLIFDSSRAYSTTQLALNGLRFSAALIVPLMYLNLPRIKSAFAFQPIDQSLDTGESL